MGRTRCDWVFREGPPSESERGANHAITECVACSAGRGRTQAGRHRHRAPAVDGASLAKALDPFSGSVSCAPPLWPATIVTASATLRPQVGEPGSKRVLATGLGGGLLLALREVCQTALTAIEAIDPATETMLEELRLEIDKRLARHYTSEASEQERIAGAADDGCGRIRITIGDEHGGTVVLVASVEQKVTLPTTARPCCG